MKKDEISSIIMTIQDIGLEDKIRDFMSAGIKANTFCERIQEYYESHPDCLHGDERERWKKAVLEYEKMLTTQKPRYMIEKMAANVLDIKKVVCSSIDGHTPSRTYIFNGKYHEIDFKNKNGMFLLEQKLSGLINSLTEGKATLTYTNEVLGKLHDIARDHNNIKINKYKHYLAFRNDKVLDTRNMSIHEKSDVIFKEKGILVNYIDVDYKPELGYQKKWQENYIDSLFPKEGYGPQKATLQEFVGYGLIDGQPAKKALYIYGVPDSGKTKFCNAIKDVFKSKTSNLSLYDITTRFGPANLYDQWYNICDDQDVTRFKWEDVEVFKKAIGSGELHAEEKYLNPFDFYSRAKFIFNGNGAPNISERAYSDDAVASRLIPLHFPLQFKTKREATLEEHFIRPPEDSTDLDAFLHHEKTKSRIINWSIDGAKRLMENKYHFSYSPTIAEVKEWFLLCGIGNTIEQFIRDKLIFAPDAHISKTDMYATYVNWCTKKGLRYDSNISFNRELSSNALIPVSSQRIGSAENRYYVWSGVDWQ